MEGAQNILGGISKMYSEKFEDCDFQGFPNKDRKAREGMRDITPGTSVIYVVKDFME